MNKLSLVVIGGLSFLAYSSIVTHSNLQKYINEMEKLSNLDSMISAYLKENGPDIYPPSVLMFFTTTRLYDDKTAADLEDITTNILGSDSSMIAKSYELIKIKLAIDRLQNLKNEKI